MRTLLILLSFSIVLCATAQAQTVSGRVTNSKGEPVSFATVKVKSSKVTVAADADGIFKIKAATGQTLGSVSETIFNLTGTGSLT